MTRPFVAILGLLALAATSVAVAEIHPGGDCGGDCAEEPCAADGQAEHATAEGRGHADAHGDDACGDRPCPCDGDDSDCPPNCHDCGCSTATVSTVAASGTPSIDPAPALHCDSEPPLERRASGVVSRVFRPPRA